MPRHRCSAFIARRLETIKAGSLPDPPEGPQRIGKAPDGLLPQRPLSAGKPIAVLPDHRTIRAITVECFGREVTTTPTLALLAVMYNRLIVVVACCRQSRDFRFEGSVSDPVCPEAHQAEKTEVFRLTAEINCTMEMMIRRHPEQYLWIHDRWKPFRSNKDLTIP